jgi:rod shape-determining protein MreD
MPPMEALDTPPWGAAIAALAVALLAQTTILHGLRFRGGGVSWVLLIVVWFAARAGPARGAFLGLCAGACEDALGGATGAAWTIATPLVAAAAGGALRLIGSANPLWFALIAGAAALARALLARGILQAQGSPAIVDAATLHALLWSALFDALVAAAALVAFPKLRPFRVDRR